MDNSSVLKDIGIYKNNIILSFTNSNDICDLMMFGKDSYTNEDVENLIYTQIYPYLYVDDTQKMFYHICV